jgi:membrane fusion protein, heavy metal efflux system
MFSNAKTKQILAGGLLVLVVGLWFAFSRWYPNDAAEAMHGVTPEHVSAPQEPRAVEIPRSVAELNHMSIAVAQLPTRERQLNLRGELAIDVNKLVHVHALFPGRIKDISPFDEKNNPRSRGSQRQRPLGFMDRVVKGQPMAVMWSKDFGEKKSELVDALANLRLDKEAYERINDLTQRGASSETSLREAERQVATGEIAVKKAELTLRSWQVPEEIIKHVKEQVEHIRHHEDIGLQEDAEWARVEITAPIGGTIVEKNVTVGDIIDSSTDLFKIADLSVLTLWLHAYEEDLPYLEQLPAPIPVTIRLPSNPEVGELPAAIESIGDIINPIEHMAVLVGHVENPRGELRAGQFVTATVALAPEEGVIEIPTRALVEDGNESVVFVQESPQEYRFQPRRVSVARRYFDVVHIHSRLSDEDKARGLQELHEGERVAASETVQLKAALRQQQLTSSDEPRKPGAAAQQ